MCATAATTSQKEMDEVIKLAFWIDIHKLLLKSQQPPTTSKELYRTQLGRILKVVRHGPYAAETKGVDCPRRRC